MSAALISLDATMSAAALYVLSVCDFSGDRPS